jgi:DNA (cytosine-5)-methyltransferase 1
MTAYYNEIDPYAAQWLRNLIKAGHIAPGDVDERSIVDVGPDDLRNYTQCHFFAGLGGWSYGLRLAAWPDDRPVWTGSCPCQPFSEGGKRAGFQDTRDLWPAWFNLIRERSPAIVFGEQVAGATIWLDRVFADLEDQDYAVAAAILPACAVDAPHRRDRLWFVADAEGISGRRNIEKWEAEGRAFNGWPGAATGSAALGGADSRHGFSWSGPVQVGRNALQGQATRGGDAPTTQWRIGPGISLLADGVPARVAKLCALGNAIVPQVAAEFIRATM